MNVCENIIVGANLFPDRDAIVFEQQRWTYAEIEKASSLAAQFLRDNGVTRGDRVGMVLSNVPAFIIWYYGVLRLGAVAVSISTRLAAEEIGFILNDCQADIVIAGPGEEDAAREAVGDAGKVIVVSECASQVQGRPISEVESPPSPNWVNTKPNDPAVILYTSGTTGFPKGATLSHQNVRATIHAFNHLCEMNGEDRILLAVPLFHCYGQNALLNSGLNVGATLILQRRFDLNESKRLISEQRVTKLFGVPTTFQLICECCEPADLSSVTYCFSAAATLPIQLSHRWQEKFGMPIYEGYGLTETAPFASYNHRLHFVPGSIGTPVDLVEMKIVDSDTGEDCPVGTLGEIAIRGPNVMLGYWNRPDETAAAIRNGWFHSGDIGRVDERGYFYIVDRVKDMIAVGGMKVFPAEVERVLLDQDGISEAAVVGFPDEVFGEQVVAFVVASGDEPDVTQIRRECQRHLAAFKVPRQIEFIDQLPRNPAGKILKTHLRERTLSTTDHPETPGLATGASPLESDAVTSLTVTEPPRLVARLADVHLASREREVVTVIQEELSEMLGSVELPGPEETLLDSGLDSLAIVELRDRLQVQVGPQLALPPTLVFDYPRTVDLASFLVESLQAEGYFESPGDPKSTNGSTRQSNSALPSRPEADPSIDSTSESEDLQSMSEGQALQELLRELEE